MRDGFAILKVGPWLTFALREALYGLDQIAGELTGTRPLQVGMETVMLADPSHWSGHYHGDAKALRLQRHFSYSDRIRYYWASDGAQATIAQLMQTLDGVTIPETLISQYLPGAWQAVATGDLEPDPKSLIRIYIVNVLRIYEAACSPGD